MLIFLKLMKSKFTAYYLIAVLACYSIFITFNNIQKSSTIKILTERTQSLSNSLEECKVRDTIREAEIAKWKSISNDKQAKLNNEISNRMKIENKLKAEIDSRWNKTKFSGVCKNDIDILRQHAISLQKR